MPVLYNVGFVNLIDVAKSYKECYSQEELQERFEIMLRNVSMSYPYNTLNGFVFRDKSKRFYHTSNDLVQNKCDVLTCLTWAIDDKNVVAEIMSDVLNQKFIKGEFENTFLT
jgi:hypothetical protein